MIAEPNCFKRSCKHYLGFKSTTDVRTAKGVHTCEAYPEEIPFEIIYGDDKHLEIREDQDNQFVYEKN
ncbi:MAG: hypothetical protein GY861_19005 [bacterium]|nr:hypothetical protein [bacterium]